MGNGIEGRFVKRADRRKKKGVIDGFLGRARGKKKTSFAAATRKKRGGKGAGWRPFVE